ncbi:MAG: phosphoserine phosphatase SerB [Leptospiraceae bacterium]|nr:phosphoserine phosphatase SerB [Leptospiraceae bacterium]
MADDRIFLFHITGADKPGILAQVMQTMSDWQITVRDVEQITSLGHLSLSLLVELKNGDPVRLYRDLKKTINSLGLVLDLDLPDEIESEPSKHWALTLLSREFHAQDIREIASALSSKNINIRRMTFQRSGDVHCIEMKLDIPVNIDSSELKQSLYAVAFENHFDVALQKENLFRRAKRLIVMDMDSTLIKQEVIDEIADFAGVKPQVAEITERAMRGEIDFATALAERVALLKGLPVSDLEKVKDRLQLTDGVKELISFLKKMGFKTAVISGGFTPFTDHFREMLQLDYSFANTLEVKDGKLTGRTTGDIVDRERKAVLLKQLAEKENISLDQTVAVGDGANDLAMLEAAGLGVAFNAKPTVKKASKAFISQPGLDAILFLLGYTLQDRRQVLDN